MWAVEIRYVFLQRRNGLAYLILLARCGCKGQHSARDFSTRVMHLCEAEPGGAANKHGPRKFPSIPPLTDAKRAPYL